MVRLAITMGDPAGIGPEIIIKALSEGAPATDCLPVVIAPYHLMKQQAERLKCAVSLKRIEEIPEGPPPPAAILILEPSCSVRTGANGDSNNIAPSGLKIIPGRIQKEAGAIAKACIDKAVHLTLEGNCDAICTAPIHKEAMHAAGFAFPGHTEYLAHLTGAKRFAMLLCGGGLRVALATIHSPLKDVPELITEDGILEKLRLLHEFIPYFGIPRPRIGVCGINPHAGEGGMFGDEESRIIRPAIEKARLEGIDSDGPLPADTLFHRMLKGDFDAILAMYHDQGLIPVKTLAFHDGVNVTMGLPFIRTSVDHGTGFDIAGKGVASPESLKAAIRLAVLLTKNRMKPQP